MIHSLNFILDIHLTFGPGHWALFLSSVLDKFNEPPCFVVNKPNINLYLKYSNFIFFCPKRQSLILQLFLIPYLKLRALRELRGEKKSDSNFKKKAYPNDFHKDTLFLCLCFKFRDFLSNHCLPVFSAHPRNSCN